MESRFLIIQASEYHGDEDTWGIVTIGKQNVFSREEALDIIEAKMDHWIDVYVEYTEITESRFWEMARQGEIGYDENFIYDPVEKFSVRFEMIELHTEVE